MLSHEYMSTVSKDIYDNPTLIATSLIRATLLKSHRCQPYILLLDSLYIQPDALAEIDFDAC